MGARRAERVWAPEGMPVRIAWALWEGEHVPLGRQGGIGKGSMSTWGRLMETRRRVWVPIVGEDGCRGERIWAMGRGEGKSLGRKLQGKYNDGQVREAV